MQVNVHEAKTKLSQLLERVEAGEDVVIARAGRPIARLVLVSTPPRRRTLGAHAGAIRIAPDFDDLPTEVLAAFEGDVQGEPVRTPVAKKRPARRKGSR